MKEVLVLVDHVDGAVRKTTHELLTAARRLGEPSAVFIGRPNGDAIAALRSYGAEKVYTIDDAEINGYLVAPVAEALAQVAVRVGAEPSAVVLLSASAAGKEIAGRLAVKLGSGLITDAVDLEPGPVATQSVFAGNYTVRTKVLGETPVIAVKPNAVDAQPIDGAGTVQAVDVVISDAAKGARITASEPRQASGRPELTEAAIVVSGGRGTAGNFGPVEALADALGGAVGASRAAVDSGWYPHAYQVGQTGKTVAPQLYVAAGISGAIQHRAGMQTSKTIVAVNKDPEAPIFELADFGVVGDLHTVLPAATEQVEERQS
ncbi:electron transfer flavoprotein subunit alpha/FixB family protein [Kribbella sp. NPDC050124]|uniref:electron transfer flavoprotein subunit alpha/FixB family protein n=1 Tax=Kribbella sp. NPDC050124 TaxID=3364114 RepID=UPI003794E70D